MVKKLDRFECFLGEDKIKKPARQAPHTVGHISDDLNKFLFELMM